MKCKNCGVELLPAQKFCYNCGTPVNCNITIDSHQKTMHQEKIFSDNQRNQKNIIDQHQCCVKCNKPISEDMAICDQCLGRITKLWPRSIAALLVIALLSGIAVHFVGNSVPKVKNAEQVTSAANDVDGEFSHEPVHAEKRVEPLTKVVMYDDGQLDREYLFDYNDNNQLVCQTLKLYNDSEKLYHETETKYSYTSDGKLSRIGEGEFRTEFTYNSKNQLVCLFSNFATSGEVRYEYDEDGKLIRSTAPNSSNQDTRSTTEYIYKDGLLVEKIMTSPNYDTDGSLVE